ncbi:hypothetical protein NEIFLAOT_02253 [Neisseria flavescens NRL30031/H210]|uniref:Uncharacterized protein n=1 Tax=Neisseria flavescens NRL30031/H210 TaxID=546264 RepID=C0EQK9_NEIFL|nr:hypothetical protein NEIFLAOT_02253 [Neisseria flavescens NRL30031/H210]
MFLRFVLRFQDFRFFALFRLSQLFENVLVALVQEEQNTGNNTCCQYQAEKETGQAFAILCRFFHDLPCNNVFRRPERRLSEFGFDILSITVIDGKILMLCLL